MSSMGGRQELEARLRSELDEAERLLLTATPKQKAEALERFKQALGRFSDLVVRGITPTSIQSSVGR
jgi:hypothetical protein